MSDELRLADKRTRHAVRFEAQPLPEPLEILVQRFHAPVRREVREQACRDGEGRLWLLLQEQGSRLQVCRQGCYLHRARSD